METLLATSLFHFEANYFAGGVVPKVKIRDLESHRFGVGVGPVGENDDRQIVIGKTLNRGAESDCAAIVVHALVAFVWIDEPSEAVADWHTGVEGCGTARGLNGNERGLHFRFAEKRVLTQGTIPFRQVIERRVD